MTSPDWRRVNSLFHQALEQPAGGRERFLDEACGADQALRAEVRSLLAAHERMASFIEERGGPGDDPGEPRDDRGGPGLQTRPGAWPTGAPPILGRTLGHYRVIGILGEGGMGIVYLADDTRLGRLVALKAVSARFTRDPAGRERLTREARAAAALTHPGIATVYALETFDDDLYLASEYVPGETLREEVARGPLSPAVVRDTAVAIAHALAAAHARGIVHRDLKPENVMRTPDGRLKILDFGLARFIDTTPPGAPADRAALTHPSAWIGTPGYMSPEQIRGGPADERSDVFALGVMMFELLSGANPFLGESAAATLANVLEREPPALAPAGGGDTRAIASRLEAIARACLHKEPAARVASARAVAEALGGAAPLNAAATPAPAWNDAGAAATRPRPAAFWWWQFHQAAASVTYLGMLAPLSLVHERRPGVAALVVLLAGLAAAIAATSLRLHLWFTARAYPAEWPRQHDVARRWLPRADLAFVLTLVTAAGVVLTRDAPVAGRVPLAVLLIAAAVVSFIAARVIEPATRRAAVGD